MKSPLNVTSAIILRETPEGTRVLVARRKLDTSIEPGKWEFPGGKLEPMESPAECLRREILEELALDIVVGEIFDLVPHVYETPSGPVAILLMCYLCTCSSSNFRLVDVSDAKWASSSELDGFDWAAADIATVAKLKRHLSRSGSLMTEVYFESGGVRVKAADFIPLQDTVYQELLFKFAKELTETGVLKTGLASRDGEFEWMLKLPDGENKIAGFFRIGLGTLEMKTHGEDFWNRSSRPVGAELVDAGRELKVERSPDEFNFRAIDLGQAVDHQDLGVHAYETEWLAASFRPLFAEVVAALTAGRPHPLVSEQATDFVVRLRLPDGTEWRPLRVYWAPIMVQKRG